MKRAPMLAVLTSLVCLFVAIGAWPASAAGAPSSLPDEAVCVTNGTVYAIAVAPDGSAYIGGAFTAVGGVTRNRIAHILADGSLDPTFDPNANNTVRALAVSGSVVYAGGDFTTVNGATTRNRIAAFDAASGVATVWNPGATGATGCTVYAFAVSGSTVYVGGYFDSIGGQSRNGIAALHATTGLATAFDARGLGWYMGSRVIGNALAVSGSTVYVGGRFRSINGPAEYHNIAALDATSGDVTAWNPDLDYDGSTPGQLFTLAVSGSAVYAGGSFTTVNGATARNCIAAFDATSGTATAWNPNASNAVFTLAVSGTAVYAGGMFGNIGGQSRNNIAAIDASGNATSWNPNANGEVRALAVSGSTVWAGGSFFTIQGQSRAYLARFSPLTGPTVFSPNGPERWTLGTVHAITWDGGDGDNVKIELSRDGGSSWETLFASTADDGNETWTVTGLTSAQALVRTSNTMGSDVSNAVFTIAPALTGSMGINGGAAATMSTSVTIDSAVAGVSEVRFSNAGGSWDAWQTYQGQCAWVLTAGEGAKTVSAEYRDADGNLLALSDTIDLDTTAPSGGFTVGDDTGYVNSRLVVLHPVATDAHGPIELQVRNAGAAWPAGWQTLTADVAWMLTVLEGEKTVEMRFRDAPGNISGTTAETVVVDATPPSGWVVIANGAFAVDTHDVTVETWANDLNGAVFMRLRNGGEPWPVDWTPAGDTVPVTLPSGEGTKVVQVQYKDLAGNICVVEDQVIVDTIDPVGSLSIDGGDPYTTTAAVILDLAASDATKVDAFRVRQDGGAWSPWQDMVEVQPLTLTGADGERTVEAQYRDIAGNTSDLVADEIVLDRLAPTASDDHDELWRRSFTLHLAGSDAGSGVVSLRYRVDGGAWQARDLASASVALRTWKRGGGSGVHSVDYQVTDAAGHESELYACTVKLDARAPTTTSDAPALPVPGPVTVHLLASDADSGVAGTWYALDGGEWTQGTSVLVAGEGPHWLAAYSVDVAGNAEYLRWWRVTIDGAAGLVLPRFVRAPGRPGR